MNTEDLQANVQAISADFAAQRRERQARRELDPADFKRLTEAGFPLVGAPERLGGLWRSIEESMRPICEALRVLAHGDPSVALVASMHPAVIVVGGWLPEIEAPPQRRAEWKAQSDWVFQTALDGHWWGTITSEPGSGGDRSKSKTVARRSGADGTYLLTGQKHFGSGSGVTSFMFTVGVPEGEKEVASFFLDMRGVPWDGSKGVKLVAPWDGHGMTATQSHAMEFKDFPATRVAWPEGEKVRAEAQVGSAACMFAAVIVGVVESDIAAARAQLERKRESMRPYEQVEWTRAQMEAWLIRQAYEGMLRSMETPANPRRQMETLMGKTAIAELAETVTARISRIVGGATFSRHSPFGHWQQDVRALGFLRPPWGLAFDQMAAEGWNGE